MAIRPVFAVLLVLSTLAEGLDVASFNIEIFGKTKYSRRNVVDVLIRIVRRYDLVFIQEIRDISETVIHDFLQDVNDVEGSFAYNVTVSERLGTSSSKEQYAYMYRINKVKIVQAFVISGYDTQFERPPYIALVHPLGATTLPPFMAIGAHIRPSNVVSELNAMTEVYEDASTLLDTKRALLMGDFNADCSYLSGVRFRNLILTTDERFIWLIDEDSTVAVSECSYDRFVAVGGVEQFVKTNASVFRFDAAYQLPANFTEIVSDHYPITLRLGGDRTSAAVESVHRQTLGFLTIVAFLAVCLTT